MEYNNTATSRNIGPIFTFDFYDTCEPLSGTWNEIW